MKSSVLNLAPNFEYFSFLDAIPSFWLVGRDPLDIFCPLSQAVILLQHRSLALWTVVAFISLFLFSCFFLFFSFGATPLTLTGRPLTGRLVILTWSPQPTTTDLLVKTSSAPHYRTVKPDRCLFELAFPTRLPRQEVPNFLWKLGSQQPSICKLLLFNLQDFCTTILNSNINYIG